MRKRRKPFSDPTPEPAEEIAASETEVDEVIPAAAIEEPEVEPEQIMGNVPVEDPELDPRLLGPVQHEPPPMTAVPAEGARVGFISCEICGAALLVDPRDMVDVPALHAEWHRKGF